MQLPVAHECVRFATFCSVNWKEAVLGWRDRAKKWKDAKGKSDADIAEAVLELREQRGDTRKLSRAAVNHWITRTDRDPNLGDFLDWCAGVGADPREILFGDAPLTAVAETKPVTAKDKKVVADLIEQHRALTPEQSTLFVESEEGQDLLAHYPSKNMDRERWDASLKTTVSRAPRGRRTHRSGAKTKRLI